MIGAVHITLKHNDTSASNNMLRTDIQEHRNNEGVGECSLRMCGTLVNSRWLSLILVVTFHRRNFQDLLLRACCGLTKNPFLVNWIGFLNSFCLVIISLFSRYVVVNRRITNSLLPLDWQVQWRGTFTWWKIVNVEFVCGRHVWCIVDACSR